MRRLGRINIMANVLNMKLETLFTLLQSEIGRSVDGYCLGAQNIVRPEFCKEIGFRCWVFSYTDLISSLFVGSFLLFTRCHEERDLDVELFHTREFLPPHPRIRQGNTG